jgi:hypothetical protein
MKRFYALALTALFLAPTASAQLPEQLDSIGRWFTVLAPAEVAGPPDSANGQASGWGGSIFFPSPQGLTGTLVYADDGFGGREGCEEFANAGDIAGNIAVISRGTCEFGLKALNAQNAGAIAFIIHQNAANAPDTDDTTMVWMGAGVNGANVTIQGIFISRFDALRIIPALEAGTPVTAQLNNRPDRPTNPAIEPNGPLTGAFEVFSARPNPFSATTEFGVRVARTEEVRVEVFNTVGQRVALLHDGALAAGDVHEFTLEASALPSGVYLYRITGESFVETRPVVLAR